MNSTPAAREVGPGGMSGKISPLSAVLWPLALAFFANLVFRSYVAARVTVDFDILHAGAVRAVAGLSVYSDPYFLLTPSGLLVVGPFGLLSHDTAFLVWNTLSVFAVVVGAACALRFAGISIISPAGAATLLALSMSESLTVTLFLGNFSNTLLLVLASGFLLAERRDRPVLAGVLLGLSFAVKPVLILVIVLPFLRRRWETLAWAIAIPAALNVLAFLLTPQKGDFLTVTIPELLAARLNSNSSLWAVGAYFGVSEFAVAFLRLLVLMLALFGAWRLRSWQKSTLQLGTGYGLLLLATFLSSSLSQGYYSMLLLPLLLTVVSAQSPMRNPLTWIAVYLFGAFDAWTLAANPAISASFAELRWTLGWVLLFGVILLWVVRGHHSPEDVTKAIGQDEVQGEGKGKLGKATEARPRPDGRV